MADKPEEQPRQGTAAEKWLMRTVLLGVVALFAYMAYMRMKARVQLFVQATQGNSTAQALLGASLLNKLF